MEEVKNELKHCRILIEDAFDKNGELQKFKHYYVVKDEKGNLQKVAFRKNVNLSKFEGMRKVEFDCKYYEPEKFKEYPRIWIGDILENTIKKIR